MGQLRLRTIRDGDARADGEVRIFLGAAPPDTPGAAIRHLPDLAPTPWLLERFGRDPRRFPTFRNRYLRLLRSKARTTILEDLARLARDRDVVLLSDDPEPETSPEAVVLEALVRRFGCRRS